MRGLGCTYRRGLGDDSGFSFDDMGVPDFTDPSWFDPSLAGSAAPLPAMDYDSLVNNVPASVPVSDGSSSGGFFDFLKAIPLIGQTVAGTYNAINHPSAPSAYQSPPATPDYQSQQASGGTDSGSTDAPGGIAAWFKNPANMPVIAIAGVAILVVAVSGEGGRR
jgi:hypothetical protein